MDVLKKAREISDATRLPIMMHWTNQRRLLDLLTTIGERLGIKKKAGDSPASHHAV
jgi:hypothetical protein